MSTVSLEHLSKECFAFDRAGDQASLCGQRPSVVIGAALVKRVNEFSGVFVMMELIKGSYFGSVVMINTLIHAERSVLHFRKC